MCGIFGVITGNDALRICLEGIRYLEYRGYDSSGVAALTHDGAIFLCRRAGKVEVLQKALENVSVSAGVAIAHTRWATHGAPTENNAHPHTDSSGHLALVHNGVIENYEKLKTSLLHEGVKFFSDTDTEVVCHLIARYIKELEIRKQSQDIAYQQGSVLLAACISSFSLLAGSYAIALIHKDFPDTMIAVAEKSPLIVGYDEKTAQTFVASDATALMGRALKLFYLASSEIAYIHKGQHPLFYDKQGKKIIKEGVDNLLRTTVSSKGFFAHYMLKEIFEQEMVIQRLIKARYDTEQKTLSFPEVKKIEDDITACEHITIIACGSSFHAGYIATRYFEEIAGVDCRIEIASEYRYGPKHHQPNTVIIALSQSGETADTLAATEECIKLGQKVISLCNVEGSTLTRISDATLFLQAGAEHAVASTKTLSAQLCVLYFLSVFLAWKKGKITISQLSTLCEDIEKIPSVAAHVLEGHRKIQALAQKYSSFHDFYFLGRGVLYPTALEAALKLKEIAYKNAVGYPAGEMKHGPIALLDNTVPTIVFCASTCLEEKIISNLRESKARGAPIIVFGWKELSSDFTPYSDDVFFAPISSDILAPIGLIIATQLFSYYMARELCLDIDRPRNLAKSVTVE